MYFNKARCSRFVLHIISQVALEIHQDFPNASKGYDFLLLEDWLKSSPYGQAPHPCVISCLLPARPPLPILSIPPES
eukprot:1147623-Pelagomonas_calceolata.AAC.1